MADEGYLSFKTKATCHFTQKTMADEAGEESTKTTTPDAEHSSSGPVIKETGPKSTATTTPDAEHSSSGPVAKETGPKSTATTTPDAEHSSSGLVADKTRAKSTVTTTPDVENPSSGAVTSRERVELLLEKARLGLRAGACVFSLVAFVVMASNKNFDEYEEYRYLVAIGALVFLYTGAQILRQLVHRLTAGREVMLKTTFVCDQVVAYLLMSALSAAIPMTNRTWEKADNSFTESLAAAISMTFFAFVTLALSAMISGFKLSNQFYI